MPAVNIWELITTVAEKPDLPNSDHCQEIKNNMGKRFGTELSFSIEDNCWKVIIFDHNDSTQYIEMSVDQFGNIITTRARGRDIYEVRTIKF